MASIPPAEAPIATTVVSFSAWGNREGGEVWAPLRFRPARDFDPMELQVDTTPSEAIRKWLADKPKLDGTANEDGGDSDFPGPTK